MRSFVKIKSSRIGDITLSFTAICKSGSYNEYLASQICHLLLFAKIKLSQKFPNYSSQIKFGLPMKVDFKKNMCINILMAVPYK